MWFWQPNWHAGKSPGPPGHAWTQLYVHSILKQYNVTKAILHDATLVSVGKYPVTGKQHCFENSFHTT